MSPEPKERSLDRSFRARAAEALTRPSLVQAVRATTDGKIAARRQALSSLERLARDGWARGGFEDLRREARAIRTSGLDQLESVLEQATRAIESRNGRVWRARGPEDAARIVGEIAARRGARLVVKSKSMATEEIGLNAALQAAGFKVVETDLGEFIVQLADDRPAHIVTPCIHKTRHEIADLFGRLVGRPVETDTPSLAAVARRVLREKFLRADIGITGANFVLADTGTVVVCTNEGNGRLVSSLPPVTIVLAGIEKIIPAARDLPVFLELLARSATGQPITVYTHLITGPRSPQEPDGPEELHVIFIDNGRAETLHSPYREMLACIRCGACLNHCPVYRQTGGHAYGSVYSGPMGVVLAPLLATASAANLPFEACSLCAACTEVCPVGIPIHELILRHRADMTGAGGDRSVLGAGLRLTARLWRRAWIYRACLSLARAGLRALERAHRVFRGGASRTRTGGADDAAPWIGALAGPFRAWTLGRDLPVPESLTFGQLWERGEVLRTGRVGQGAPPQAEAGCGEGTLSRPGEGKGPAAGPVEELGTLPDRDTDPRGAPRARPGEDDPARTPRGLDERVERFKAALEGLDGRVYRAADEKAMVSALVEICRAVAQPGSGVVISSHPLLADAGAADLLASAGFRPVATGVTGGGGDPDSARRQWREEAERAAVGVTVGRYAVAATGSVVLHSDPGQGRLASLLPSVQVTVVPESHVLATLDELFRHLTAEPLASSVALVTGPSRSADIENELILGMHGPREVHVILVGSELVG